MYQFPFSVFWYCKQVTHAGETKTLTATLAPAEATGTIAWYTSNAAVATVADGVITAQTEGTATITAVCGGLAATCAVTVTAE